MKYVRTRVPAEDFLSLLHELTSRGEERPDIALQLGISSTTIWNIEHGEVRSMSSKTYDLLRDLVYGIGPHGTAQNAMDELGQILHASIRARRIA